MNSIKLISMFVMIFLVSSVALAAIELSAEENALIDSIFHSVTELKKVLNEETQKALKINGTYTREKVRQEYLESNSNIELFKTVDSKLKATLSTAGGGEATGVKEGVEEASKEESELGATAKKYLGIATSYLKGKNPEATPTPEAIANVAQQLTDISSKIESGMSELDKMAITIANDKQRIKALAVEIRRQAGVTAPTKTPTVQPTEQPTVPPTPAPTPSLETECKKMADDIKELMRQMRDARPKFIEYMNKCKNTQVWRDNLDHFKSSSRRIKKIIDEN
ncbi:hypothetical protein ACFLZ7_01830 [Nanoarchaeota archaeon]